MRTTGHSRATRSALIVTRDRTGIAVAHNLCWYLGALSGRRPSWPDMSEPVSVPASDATRSPNTIGSGGVARTEDANLATNSIANSLPSALRATRPAISKKSS